jgi:ribonuclease T2
MKGLGVRLVTAALAVFAAAPGRAQDQPGDFDFYVLSLSWSPAFCALEESAGAGQCREGAGFSFVAHGLWPQHERGYPEFCGKAEELSPGLVESIRDIMPDDGLIAHEWRRHGACTGLSAEDYFAATRAAFHHIVIPEDFDPSPTQDIGVSADAIETAFIAANPGLHADGIAVSCKQGLMAEVRICLTRDLDFRACQEVDARGCRDDRLFIVPAD